MPSWKTGPSITLDIRLASASTGVRFSRLSFGRESHLSTVSNVSSVELHNSVGVGERYHETFCAVFDKVVTDH